MRNSLKEGLNLLALNLNAIFSGGIQYIMRIGPKINLKKILLL